MNIVDFKKECLKNILGYFRQNDDVRKFLQLLAERGNSIESSILKLLSFYDIHQARGIFLDYIGDEIGSKRDETDYGNYFCVNLPHINVDKLFYFLTSGADPRNPILLSDAEFLQKIFAYIGINKSCGCLEETISIIKTITDADNVQIIKGDNNGVKIKLIGENILITRNTINYIKQVLGDGIYLEEIITNE